MTEVGSATFQPLSDKALPFWLQLSCKLACATSGAVTLGRGGRGGGEGGADTI